MKKRPLAEQSNLRPDSCVLMKKKLEEADRS
jgi:hypothetical protein